MDHVQLAYQQHVNTIMMQTQFLVFICNNYISTPYRCFCAESKHNKLKGKDSRKPTAQDMVKELSQAREDHLNNFLSTSDPQPHCTAWGAQDLSRDNRDDANSEDTWSSDSENEGCCSCYRMPHYKRELSSINHDDEMNTCLVSSDELSQEHEQS